MIQTPTHVSLLQQILTYFELAGTIGTELPEPHVSAISALIESLTAGILAFKNTPPQPVAQPQVPATVQIPAVVPVVNPTPQTGNISISPGNTSISQGNMQGGIQQPLTEAPGQGATIPGPGAIGG